MILAPIFSGASCGCIEPKRSTPLPSRASHRWHSCHVFRTTSVSDVRAKLILYWWTLPMAFYWLCKFLTVQLRLYTIDFLWEKKKFGKFSSNFHCEIGYEYKKKSYNLFLESCLFSFASVFIYRNKKQHFSVSFTIWQRVWIVKGIVDCSCCIIINN